MRVSGGIAHSPIARQVFADALDARVETVSAKETGAVGAAIVAGVGAGLFADVAAAAASFVTVTDAYTPDPPRRDRLAEAYGRYQRLVDALQPLWPDLSGMDAASPESTRTT